MAEAISDQNDELKLIDNGNDAEQLLQNETFNQTINGMVEGTWQAFAASGPDDTAMRERTYAHYRALVDIIHTLQQRVNVRDEIIAKNDDEADNDNSGDE